MPRYVRVLDSPSTVPRVADTLAEWVDVNDLIEIAESGGITVSAPVETPDGVEDTFTFSAPPKLIFRNGVMENRKGSVVGNTFVFNSPPQTGDDIEGLI